MQYAEMFISPNNMVEKLIEIISITRHHVLDNEMPTTLNLF